MTFIDQSELGPAPVMCQGCGFDATPDAYHAFECTCEHGSCTECGVPYASAEERTRRECGQCLADYEREEERTMGVGCATSDSRERPAPISGTGNIAGAQSADPRTADRDSGLASGGAAFSHNPMCTGCLQCWEDA